MLGEVNSDPEHPSPPTTRKIECPEDPTKEVPGESAQGCEQRPLSTRFPEDPYSQDQERVLGEVNSGP